MWFKLYHIDWDLRTIEIECFEADDQYSAEEYVLSHFPDEYTRDISDRLHYVSFFVYPIDAMRVPLEED